MQEWAAAKPYDCRSCGKRFSEHYRLDAHRWVCGKPMAVLEQVGIAFASGSLALDSMCCVSRCVAGVGCRQAVQVFKL